MTNVRRTYNFKIGDFKERFPELKGNIQNVDFVLHRRHGTNDRVTIITEDEEFE
jgi:hypothetical protein